MKYAIMQPNFLPWAGYFNLLKKVDEFIFFDDVQFSKNSWNNRNLILLKNKKIWMTVPLKKSKLNTNLNHKKIDYKTNWKKKITNLVMQSYAKHPFKHNLKELFDFINDLNCDVLSDLNILIIKFISDKLKIESKFSLSSNFNIDKKRTDKIIGILETTKATEYISPFGAKDYLTEDEFKKKTNIKLIINNFIPKSYNQMNSSQFVSHLSMVDVIGNIGWDGAKNYIGEE